MNVINNSYTNKLTALTRPKKILSMAHHRCIFLFVDHHHLHHHRKVVKSLCQSYYFHLMKKHILMCSYKSNMLFKKCTVRHRYSYVCRIEILSHLSFYIFSQFYLRCLKIIFYVLKPILTHRYFSIQYLITKFIIFYVSFNFIE